MVENHRDDAIERNLMRIRRICRLLAARTAPEPEEVVWLAKLRHESSPGLLRDPGASGQALQSNIQAEHRTQAGAPGRRC